MRDFFRGWRRRIGCVLLLFAIGLFVVWGRSYVVEDNLTISLATRSHLLTSLDGVLIWEVSGKSDSEPRDIYSWDSKPANFPWLSPWVTRGLLPRTEFAGIEYGGRDSTSEGEREYYRWYIMPYGWLTLACSLPAAYLILVGPRITRAASAPK